MTDTPEDVLRAAEKMKREGYGAAILTRYAALLERVASPASDEQVDAAEIAYGSTYTKWKENHKEAMRAALDASRASLLGGGE